LAAFDLAHSAHVARVLASSGANTNVSHDTAMAMSESIATN